MLMAGSFAAPLAEGQGLLWQAGAAAQTMRVISLDRPHHHYGTVPVRLGRDIYLILCSRANGAGWEQETATSAAV